jgi:pyruvate dehydrogenase E2 component (dihydrolipoamide acetyltransferase)
MPSLGADMETGTLVEWLIAPGSRVHRGDTVAVIETQKGAIEIEIFEEGVVHRLEAALGDDLPVGAPMAIILAEGEAAPSDDAARTHEPQAASGPAPLAAAPPVASPRPSVQPATTVPPSQGGAAASPAARLRARELGVDLASIEGSGPNGVIVLSDIERTGPGGRREPQPSPAGSPMTEMRKAIAAAMTRSKETIPHVYLSHTIDLQQAIDWLAAHNREKPPQERILLGALFVRATALAARDSKDLNGHYLADGFHASDMVNPGVAVALRGGGLVAPALMDAPAMTLTETMAGIRDLVTRARAGRLKGSEMTGGTITVSALGESGCDMMTGIIFPPQVALVGLGAPQTRPWVVDGTVVPRSVVTVCVSADHRVADGRQISRFITEFETLLQRPEAL